MSLLEATTQSAEELLRPYLDATLSLAVSTSPDSPAVEPLFSLYYIEHPPRAADDHTGALIVPPGAPPFPEVADSVATRAEGVFWKAVDALKALGVQPRAQDEGDGESSVQAEVDAFWPPLDSLPDEDEW